MIRLRPATAVAALLLLTLTGCTGTASTGAGAASTGPASTGPASTGPASTGAPSTGGAAAASDSAAGAASGDAAAWTAGFCGHVQEALRTTAALTAAIPPTPPLTAGTLEDWQQRLREQGRAADAAVAAVAADLASAPPELAAASEPVAALTRGLVAADAGTDVWVTPLVTAADLAAVRQRMVSAGTVAAELHSGAVQLSQAAQRALSCR